MGKVLDHCYFWVGGGGGGGGGGGVHYSSYMKYVSHFKYYRLFHNLLL